MAVMFYFVVSSIAVVVINGQSMADSGPGRVCRLRCGIVDELLSNGQSLFDTVVTAWRYIQQDQQKNGHIEMTFIRLERRQQTTVDNIIDTYMEIGSVNVSAIIGPYLATIAMTTNKFHIPYFVTSLVGADPIQLLNQFNAVVLLPVKFQLQSITFDLIRSANWPSVAILYSDGHEKLFEQFVLQLPDVVPKALKIDAQMPNSKLRQLLLTLRRQVALTRLVVMTSQQLINRLLEQAVHVGLLTDQYVWILATVSHDELHLLNYTEVGSCLLTYRVRLRNHRYPATTEMVHSPIGQSDHQVQLATVYDSLLAMSHCAEWRYRTTSGTTCHCMTQSADLQLALSNLRFEASSGQFHFDTATSLRAGHVVEIIRVNSTGSQIVALWNSSQPANSRIAFNSAVQCSDVDDSHYPLGTSKVHVIFPRLEEPFVMLRHNNSDATLGYHERFEGLFVDVIKQLAATLNFRYTIDIVNYIQDDRTMSSRSDWNNLVELFSTGNVDLTILPMTTIATYRMTSLVDVSMPFYDADLGVAVSQELVDGHLLRSQNRQTVHNSTLSVTAWLAMTTSSTVCLLVAVLVVSTAERIRQRRASRTVQRENNSHVASAVTRRQQHDVIDTDTSLLKGSVCRRTLSYTVRFIVVVTLVTYTANLAAILTAVYLSPAGKSNVVGLRHVTLRDIVNAGFSMRYMTVRDSDVTYALKQTTEPSQWRQMWRTMTSHTESSVESVDAGLSRVENDSNKVFVWHKPGLRYQIDSRTTDCRNRATAMTSLRPLDLDEHNATVRTRLKYSVVGRRSTHVHAVRPIDHINKALLQLSQQDFFSVLDRRWWSGSECPPEMQMYSDVREPSPSTDVTLGDVCQLFVTVTTAASLVTLIAAFAKLITLHRDVIMTSSNKNKSATALQSTPTHQPQRNLTSVPYNDAIDSNSTHPTVTDALLLTHSPTRLSSNRTTFTATATVKQQQQNCLDYYSDHLQPQHFSDSLTASVNSSGNHRQQPQLQQQQETMLYNYSPHHVTRTTSSLNTCFRQTQIY